MDSNKLRKLPILDQLLENTVAKSDDGRHRLYKLAGKYVLLSKIDIDATDNGEAIDRANEITKKYNNEP